MTQFEFGQKLNDLRAYLFSLTRRFTADREASDDLVQETLLRAWMHQDKFRDDSNFTGWLFTIMRNTFINGYRKGQRLEIRRFQGNELYLNAEEMHTFNRPHESVEFKEMLKAVNGLKAELLTPFKLHATGYKYHEIAVQLGLPLGTVKTRIFHARKEIQKRLQGYSLTS
ncbi:MAG TPA: RNA polymerase sigma factor [Ohtaekwangia sp.]|nr:RNA polymerase sigma factor [Ohtaekwangia sp.]